MREKRRQRRKKEEKGSGPSVAPLPNNGKKYFLSNF
jgi:hypothetical protein